MNTNLIRRCKDNDRSAQRQVFDLLSPKLNAVALRYLKSEPEAEEALADSFYIIFTKIHQLKQVEAFEGWARKIVVNQCLSYLRKRNNFQIYLEENHQHPEVFQESSQTFVEEDMDKMLQYLPEGCKTIFNLFVIEGFSHKEIAKQLGVSVGTSKSQLNFAKNKLQDLYHQLYHTKVNEQ